MSEQYNGWANRPTWLVKLWLDNDDALAKRLTGHNGIYIQDEVISLVTEDVKPSLQLDLLNDVLEDVNWVEISEALKND